LQLPPARELSSVEIDGEPLPEPRWYLPMYLDPGEHSIAVAAPGKVRRSVKVNIPREPSAQLIPIPALQDAPVTEAPAPKRSRNQSPRTSATGRGSRASRRRRRHRGGRPAGAVFGVMTVQEEERHDAHCAANACDATASRRTTMRQKFGLISTIGSASEPRAVITGTILYFTAPRGTSRRDPSVRAGASIGGVFDGGSAPPIVVVWLVFTAGAPPRVRGSSA